MQRYLLNMKTYQLSPLPNDGKSGYEEFIPENTIEVDAKTAKRIGEASHEECERIVQSILGRRMLANENLSPAAKKVFKAGLAALNLQAEEEAASPQEEAPEDDEGINLEVETHGSAEAMLTKRQVAKLNHPNLLKYARETLGIDCADNEPYESIKAKVYAKQFGE